MIQTKLAAVSSQKTAWALIATFAVLAVATGFMIAVLDVYLALILFLPVIPIIWILHNYRVGVVLLAFILPFSNSYLLPKFAGFNLVGYLSLATLFAFLLHQAGSRESLLRPPGWLLVLYVLPISIAAGVGVFHIHEIPGWLLATEAFADNTPARYIKRFLVYPLLTLLWMWLLAHAMRESPRPQRYILLLCASGTIPAIALFIVIAILGTAGISVEELSGSSAATTRDILSLTGFHANELGILLASVFGPLLFLMTAATSIRDRIILWVMLGIVTMALLLTFTRGAYVAAGIAVLFFLVRSRGSPFAKTFVVITIVVAIIALGGVLVSRVSQGWTGNASFDTRAAAVTSSRTEMWRALWPDVTAHPLVGNGLHSTLWSSPVRSGVFPSHPHNLYLEIVLDIGLIGLILLLMFYRRFAMLLKQASQLPQAPPMISAYLSGAYAALIGFLVSAIANGHFTPVPENTYFWASLGVALAFSSTNGLRQVPANSDALSPPGARLVKAPRASKYAVLPSQSRNPLRSTSPGRNP